MFGGANRIQGSMAKCGGHAMVVAVLFGLEPLKGCLNASVHRFTGHNPAGLDVRRASDEIGLHLLNAWMSVPRHCPNITLQSEKPMNAETNQGKTSVRLNRA